MPQDVKNASVLSLFKNKGCKYGCGNYRGISFLPIAGKIRARAILNRQISSGSEESQPDAQCGFGPGHSTVDMVFLVRQFQETFLVRQVQETFWSDRSKRNASSSSWISIFFIDLAKALDTVNGGHSGSYPLSVAIPESSPISFVFSMTA